MSVEVSPAPANWGRWGEHDERGALNIVVDQTRLDATRQVTRGQVFSLAHVFDADAPRTIGRKPMWHTATVRRHSRRDAGNMDDVLTLQTHTGTHVDALCHSWEPGGLYNGFDHREITSEGAPHLGIHNMEALATRGLLLDLSSRCPRGEQGWGYEVTVDDLEAVLDEAGLEIRAGDAVLIYTGWSREFTDDLETFMWGEPGIGPDAAAWLAERDVVLVGADNWAVEAIPPAQKGVGLPVHTKLLNENGIYIMENVKLDEAVAALGTCAGLIVVAPIRLRGGAGSPVNPVFLV